jgi:hypothetical protein
MASLIPRTGYRLVFALALLSAVGPALQDAGDVVCPVGTTNGEGPPRDEDESARDAETVSLPGTRADHCDRAGVASAPSARLPVTPSAHPPAVGIAPSRFPTPCLGIRLRC